MNSITNNALLMMERSMDFLWTKQTAILDNLANVETPNYKTKYVTFEETFRSRLQAASNGQCIRYEGCTGKHAGYDTCCRQ